MILQIDACVYCKLPQRQVYLAPEQYQAFSKAYDAPYHECTSSDDILGGGHCCDLIGHRIIQDELGE